jgi:anti-anti-sigma factor
MMPTLLSLETTVGDDGQLILTATGEIDLSNIGAFDQALADATAEVAGGGKLTVDLSGVDYLDSSAINALFSQADHIHVIAHPLLLPSLTVSGLAELVTIEAAAPER